MERLSGDKYLVEITQQQKFAVSVEAESEQQAIELANCQYGRCECEFPPEILTEQTRIVE